MADSKEPKVLSTSLHLKDGTPTTDKSKAVSAEVVTENPGGGVTHTLLMRKPADGKSEDVDL
jgi:hypothetical protein